MAGVFTPPPLSGPTTKKKNFFYACLPLIGLHFYKSYLNFNHIRFGWFKKYIKIILYDTTKQSYNDIFYNIICQNKRLIIEGILNQKANT